MVLIGVLALQGAFEEHETALRSCSPSISTVQIRTASQIRSLSLDGIVLPGGESTAMGLVGQVTESIWDELKKFINVDKKPAWGTCAGMILLAEKVVGASAVIVGDLYPGVFIRAPAILSVSSDITVLSEVDAVPCRQANTTLEELDERIARGEDVTMLGVKATDDEDNWRNDSKEGEEEGGAKKKRKVEGQKEPSETLTLPGATGKGGSRRVVCAARKGNVLCTSFHPELTEDLRWHEYWLREIVGADI